MQLRCYLFIFTLFLFLSCEKKTENNSRAEEIYAVDLAALKENIIPVPSVKSIKLLSIKIDTAHLITDIDRVFYHQDKLFVIDPKMKSISVLDTLGNFLYKIGNTGEGPGEYTAIYGTALDRGKEELLLFSMEKRKMIKYSLEGKLIGEKKISSFIYDFLVLPNGGIAAFLNSNGDKDNNHDLLILDKDYSVKEKYFPFNYEDYGLTNSFSGGVSPTSNGFLFAPILSDTIFEYAHEQLFPKYILNFEVPTDYRQESASKKMDFLRKEPQMSSYINSGFMKLKQFLFLPYTQKGRLKFLIYDENKQIIYNKESLEDNNVAFKMLSSSHPFIGIKDENTMIGLIDSEEVEYLKKNEPDFIERLKKTPYYEQVMQMKNDNGFILAFITLK